MPAPHSLTHNTLGNLERNEEPRKLLLLLLLLLYKKCCSEISSGCDVTEISGLCEEDRRAIGPILEVVRISPACRRVP